MQDAYYIPCVRLPHLNKDYLHTYIDRRSENNIGELAAVD